MAISKTSKKSHLTKNMFLDEAVDIARYDQLKYPELDKITDKQLGFFWRPEEVDVSKDKKDFNELNDFEKHIFTSNLKRQILLDSVQGRDPAISFLPISSLPEVENWILTWTFFETIHSRSYTHIIRNVYANPSIVFDNIMDSSEIVDCAQSISKYYDDLTARNKISAGHGSLGHKKAVYMAMMGANALEGIRFYVSFACSWAFAELKKMEGNAKIIKLIARDENVHLAASTTMIKRMVKEDPDMAKIAEECVDEVAQMYIEVIEQEKSWAKYLFKDGSMIGLNAALLNQYVEYIANRRLKALGFNAIFDAPVNTNPLPWTQHWLSSSGLQVAPQETEVESYVIGGIKQDVTTDSIKGFSL